ncbi:unnamed protein product (macronuclear) [Paramecium tetraurelia]|uniref:Uncharacterized protein n=1 Tax=Paramecium tetraurelia TaxID=5888 RepID=A0E1R3_PARTE|nr:uncharacterized protein GSPATT00022401001 [Paramecium tetraurelia]CAK89230.1 unnamed protein product [Paramecium tetraurelia]|eukprot:XP_001456627.1 hypothetical protein (macronuclear) [Paramecium tetraurelia strain d4-2]
MNSHIYLTTHQLHEMFVDPTQVLVSPSFVEPTTPPSKEKRYFFQEDVTSPSKKDDKSTENYSNRKISQNSIFDSKVELKLTNKDLCIKNLQEQQNKSKEGQIIIKLQQELQQQSQIILSLQNQIQILKGSNQKYHSSVSQLLSQIKKLEQENQSFQDQLLKTRLGFQDQIKQQQQIKIDMENAKIKILNKDQMIESLNQQLSSFRQELSKTRIAISPNRVIEQTHYPPSVSYINYRIAQQRSNSNNLKNF